ncbi:Membrane protein [Penicillium taxi]|uniref:Membrane protein n=1 Tax=Penicillium taxi TaxID=168475 RepID=UPI00254578FF|nr:Membrane protein [Penicillium taxi]KAJ5893242.1 Membrane protein [Penicillium taxi]
MGIPETIPTKSAAEVDDRDVERDNVPYHWYRGVFFQATIVGLAAFVAPGLYNAMQSTGAGGQQTPYLVMAGNAILNCCMVLTCIFGSVIANRFGLRATFVFGTTGYAIYSASLYANNRYGTEWFIYLGSAACGITAGAFWAAEGAIMLSYPEPHQRGRYLAYWLAYRNGGSIIGGIINLAFNYAGTTTGKLNWRTYIIFVALQCLGPFIAIFVSPPEKVQRKNGTKVEIEGRISTITELKAYGQLLSRKEVLLVLPLFLYATWPLSYIGSYLSLYFSVRSRALASLVSAIAQIITNIVFGSFLDWKRFSLQQRAKWSYIFMVSLILGCWVWGVVVQKDYGAHNPKLDWASHGFGRGWALYILWQVNFAIIYNYCYWMVGFMAEKPNEIVRYTSIVRGVEAAGGAIAAGISSTHAPLIAALGVNFGLIAVAILPAWFVIRKIGTKETPNLYEDDEGQA